MSEPPEPTKKKRALPRWLDRVFLLVGLVLLAYVLSRYPLRDLLAGCARLGPWVATTPLVAMLWFACNTTALHRLLERRVSWLALFRIRLIGDGYNALLPLAGFGGEPFMVKHLSTWLPVDQVLTARVRDRVIENAVGYLYTGTWLGLAALSHRFALPRALVIGIVGYAIFAAIVGGASLAVVATTLPGRASARVAKWLGLDAGGASAIPLGELAWLLLIYFGARIAGTLEAFVLFRLLGLGSDLLSIAFTYSLLSAAGFLGFAIPAGIGVFEGTTIYLFELLGFPGPIGVAYALARRGRMLVVGLAGVALHLLLGLGGERKQIDKP